MSNQFVSLDLFAFGNYEVQDMEGKLLTIVESIGLPQKQEEAVKGLVRQTIWNTVNQPFRVYLPEDLIAEAAKRQEEANKVAPRQLSRYRKSK